MLKIGNLVVAGTVAIGTGGCAVAPAALSMAALNQDQRPVSESVASCREHADAVTRDSAPRQAQNAIARGLISLVATGIRGGNTTYPLQSLATGSLYGAESDRNRVERNKDAEFNRCMRQHEVASRSR